MKLNTKSQNEGERTYILLKQGNVLKLDRKGVAKLRDKVISTIKAEFKGTKFGSDHFAWHKAQFKKAKGSPKALRNLDETVAGRKQRAIEAAKPKPKKAVKKAAKKAAKKKKK